MLTELEMYEKVKRLWTDMTDEEWQFDLYMEKPIKGRGHKGGGEYYLYKKAIGKYVFSFSERGTEHIIIESIIFEDIEYEIAWRMIQEIIFLLRKKGKYEWGGDWRSHWEMRLDLLKKTNSTIYQKAKSIFDQQLRERNENGLETNK